MNFSEFHLERMDEITLSKRTDYTIQPKKYVEAFNKILNSKKYEQLAVFSVDGKDYYCTLIMRGIYLEPHFGVFVEDSFKKLQDSIVRKDSVEIRNILQSGLFAIKDGYLNDNSNLIKIVSYVFSILSDYLSKKEIALVRIMGNSKKFNIYDKIVKSNLQKMPYKILKYEDTEYTDENENILPAKSVILKYNFA